MSNADHVCIRKLGADLKTLALNLGMPLDEADQLSISVTEALFDAVKDRGHRERVEELVKDMIRSLVNDPETVVGIPTKTIETIARVIAEGLIEQGYQRILPPGVCTSGHDQHGLPLSVVRVKSNG